MVFALPAKNAHMTYTQQHLCIAVKPNPPTRRPIPLYSKPFTHSQGERRAQNRRAQSSYIKSGGDRCRPRQSFERSVFALFQFALSAQFTSQK